MFDCFFSDCFRDFRQTRIHMLLQQDRENLKCDAVSDAKILVFFLTNSCRLQCRETVIRQESVTTVRQWRNDIFHLENMCLQ